MKINVFAMEKYSHLKPQCLTVWDPSARIAPILANNSPRWGSLLSSHTGRNEVSLRDEVTFPGIQRHGGQRKTQNHYCPPDLCCFVGPVMEREWKKRNTKTRSVCRAYFSTHKDPSSNICLPSLVDSMCLSPQ